MLYTHFILFCLLSLCFIEQSFGHGYLVDPPARSSAWLFDKDFSKCCQYYNHAEMSCGGTFHQWKVTGGKCSICGEADDLKPQLLGMGDAKYLGKIVRTYVQGSVIPITVVLTANHLGVFEFRVCNIDDNGNKDATQNCLDLNVLQSTNGLTQYEILRTYTTVHLNVTLPSALVCKHCVFQWKYRTGNSWGEANGKSCLGCGKQNEEFYGCSDIAIVSVVEAIANPLPTTTVSALTTKFPRKCTSTGTFSQSFDIGSIVDQYCQAVCPNDCFPDKINGNEVIYQGCVNTCAKLCACQ